MPNSLSDDYNRFIGKYITVVYEYGSKRKKLYCKLLEHYKSDSGDKFVILKVYKNLFYHIKCGNIIYFIAEYKDHYESETNSIFVNTKAQREEFPLGQSNDIKGTYEKVTSSNSIESCNNDRIKEDNHIHSENKANSAAPKVYIDTLTIITNEPSINYIMKDDDLNPDKPVVEFPRSLSLDIKDSYEENTSVILNDRISSDETKEDSLINSENMIRTDTPQVLIDNPPTITDESSTNLTDESSINHTDEPSINHIMTDKNLNSNKPVTEHINFCGYDSILEQYESNINHIENCLSSPLAIFINWAFRGVHLTIYTTSGESISGEVVFNYNHIIALKSESITYYINPEQIEYFY